MLKEIIIMDVYEAISKRKTIRDFADVEIPINILNKLLKAGLKAPSNDHLRRWEFVLLQDKRKRLALINQIHAPNTIQEATTIINDWGLVEPSQREMYIDAIPKQHSMLLRAGALILPCFYSDGSILKPETLSSLNGFASIWCCIENILIAAVGEGIYGVTRIPMEEERRRLKSLLNIPTKYEVPCYLVLGYPKDTAKRMEQFEVRLDNKIHIDCW
jgi:nitroreductase